MKQSINHLTAEMQYAYLKDEFSAIETEMERTVVHFMIGLALTPVIFATGYAMLKAFYFINHGGLVQVFG